MAQTPRIAYCTRNFKTSEGYFFQKENSYTWRIIETIGKNTIIQICYKYELEFGIYDRFIYMELDLFNKYFTHNHGKLI